MRFKAKFIKEFGEYSGRQNYFILNKIYDVRKCGSNGIEFYIIVRNLFYSNADYLAPATFEEHFKPFLTSFS